MKVAVDSLEPGGYKLWFGAVRHYGSAMGRIAAIFAVVSFLSLQFVHVAVLDAADAHADAVAHHYSEPHDLDSGVSHDGADHDGGLDALHGSVHDYHNITCLSGDMLLAMAVPDGNRFVIRARRDHGRSLRPPVPPPLA